MKKRKVLSMLLGICMIFGLLLGPVQTAGASEANEDILQARKGILQVAVLIRVDGEDAGYTQAGTGFLIGGDDGAQTIITNYHVAHAVTEEWVRERLGLDENAKVELELKIIVKRDVFIGAAIVNESRRADFSILKLEQPIYDRVPLTLADSSSVVTTQEVFALGFPGIVQDIQVDDIYTSDDVTVTSGIVSKTSDVALVDTPIPCITHSARLAEGNSGGPLVDKNGYVIGVNTIISNDQDGNNDYFFSTQINEIREVLDALGVEYKSVGGAASAPTETSQQEATADVPGETEAAPESTAPVMAPAETQNQLLGQLKSAIDLANAQNLEGMTTDSVDNFRSALNAAEAVYRNTAASDAEIEKAITDLETAKNGLVEDKGSNTTLILLIAAAAIVVIIVIVVIILVVSSNKKKKLAMEQAEMLKKQRMAAAQGGASQGANTGNPSGWNSQRPQNDYQQKAFGNPASFTTGSDGSTETSVLNDGAGETTLLSGGSGLPQAFLVRKKNNERIAITKQVFKVGKERRRVDYCVSDNSNVSRTHADIVYKNGGFYIVDNNATNGTTVNGAAVAAGQERRLSSGDILRLADEEFKFQM